MTDKCYDAERMCELDEQLLVLENEYVLLHRTCENIALWNLATVGKFPRYVIVVGFRYAPASAERPRSLKAMRYVYDGLNPKLLLSSYTCSHAEVQLNTLERGLPRQPIPLDPLLRELASVRREIKRVQTMQGALVAYAPGGPGYQNLVRKNAQLGMTRYHFRSRANKRLRE